MIFRQLFDEDTSSYTYLIADPHTGEAALVDPVLEQVDRDLQLIEDLGLRLTTVLETHVHADHITGAGKLRERTGCKVVASHNGASCSDVHVDHDDVIHVGSLAIRALATPGHTDDSLSFHVGNKVFTGDALLIRGCGRTDFQNGDAGQLYDAVQAHLFTLPDETEVYPAHDYKGHTSSTIGEERRHNRRLVGRSREEFIELMAGLNLPRPRYIDVAVPANRACGLVEGTSDESSLG